MPAQNKLISQQQRAEQALHDKNYWLAIQEFTALIKKGAAQHENYLFLAKAYHRHIHSNFSAYEHNQALANYDEAIKCIGKEYLQASGNESKLIELTQKLAQCHYQYAECYLLKNNSKSRKSALKHYELATELAPHNLDYQRQKELLLSSSNSNLQAKSNGKIEALTNILQQKSLPIAKQAISSDNEPLDQGLSLNRYIEKEEKFLRYLRDKAHSARTKELTWGFLAGVTGAIAAAGILSAFFLSPLTLTFTALFTPISYMFTLNALENRVERQRINSKIRNKEKELIRLNAKSNSLRPINDHIPNKQPVPTQGFEWEKKPVATTSSEKSPYPLLSSSSPTPSASQLEENNEVIQQYACPTYFNA